MPDGISVTIKNKPDFSTLPDQPGTSAAPDFSTLPDQPIAEPTSFKEKLSKAANWATTSLLPESGVGTTTGPNIGADTPIIRNLFPGGIHVPSMQEVYEGMRPLYSPLALGLEGAGSLIGSRAMRSDAPMLKSQPVRPAPKLLGPAPFEVTPEGIAQQGRTQITTRVQAPDVTPAPEAPLIRQEPRSALKELIQNQKGEITFGPSEAGRYPANIGMEEEFSGHTPPREQFGAREIPDKFKFNMPRKSPELMGSRTIQPGELGIELEGNPDYQFATVFEAYYKQFGDDALGKIVQETQKGRRISDLFYAFKERAQKLATSEEGVLRINRGDPKKKVKDTPERATIADTTVNRLIDSMFTAQKTIGEQEKLRSQELAKRFQKVAAVKTPGMRGYYEQLSAMKGELPELELNKLKLKRAEIDNLRDIINNSKIITTSEKLNATSGLLKILKGEVPQRSEVKLLTEVYGDKFGAAIQMHSGIPVKLAEISNAMKSAMAGGDLSAPLEQGMPLWISKEYWRAFMKQFGQAWDQKTFDASQQAIQEHPLYLPLRDAGLYLAKNNADIGAREEAYASTSIEKIPLYGTSFIKGSERGYVGFLNNVRFPTAVKLIDKLRAIGDLKLMRNKETGELFFDKPELARQVADTVNTGTGRGSLGRFEKNAVELNAFFFSPRYWASRIQMMNPKYYTDPQLNPVVRKERLKQLFAAASGGLILAGMNAFTLGALGKSFSIEHDDPTSSNFGRIKVGNVRFDPWRGAQREVVAASRFITALAKGQNVMPILVGGAGKYKGYIRGMESPLVGFFDYVISGSSNYPPSGIGALAKNKLMPSPSDLGNKLGINSSKAERMEDISAELLNRYFTMLGNDIVDIMQEDPNLLPMVPFGVFGERIMSYPDQPAQQPKFRLRLK